MRKWLQQRNQQLHLLQSTWTVVTCMQHSVRMQMAVRASASSFALQCVKALPQDQPVQSRQLSAADTCKIDVMPTA
jgi:hypothetical protein